jgi:hypothetical protein
MKVFKTHLAVQVKVYLKSGDFAAQQAARKARGGRGIIINAGGPRLLSSAMVAIKVNSSRRPHLSRRQQ